MFSPFFIPPSYSLHNDIAGSSSCQYPKTSFTANAMALPAVTHPSAQPPHPCLVAIATRHTPPGNHSKRAYQGMSQGMSDTPTKTRINVIIRPIPRVIRNIRHHKPQANLQVGLTSLSICSFSFPCFLHVPSLSIDRIASVVLSIHYSYSY